MKKKRILVCPLDWGLGHASRDVPLIKKLLVKDFEVIIGGGGSSLEFLKIHFPGLEVINIPSYKFVYSKHFPAWLMIMLQIPAFIQGIITEHRYLKKIIPDYNIHAIISDARYGLWNHSVPSIIVTHQVRIKMPCVFKIFEFAMNYLNRFALGKFSQIWIPDKPGAGNLGGDLSHPTRLPEGAIFIGILSGFEDAGYISNSSDDFELVLLLSGPEPQRSIFEKKVMDQLLRQKRKSLVIGGLTGETTFEDLSESCRRISFLTGSRLYNILKNARYILCRAGYSTIMDLAAMGKTAFLVPTPGQTEQEYLAFHLREQELFLSSVQKDFDLEQAIESLDNFRPGDFPGRDDILLDEAIDHYKINITERITTHPAIKPE